MEGFIGLKGIGSFSENGRDAGHPLDREFFRVGKVFGVSDLGGLAGSVNQGMTLPGIPDDDDDDDDDDDADADDGSVDISYDQIDSYMVIVFFCCIFRSSAKYLRGWLAASTQPGSCACLQACLLAWVLQWSIACAHPVSTPLFCVITKQAQARQVRFLTAIFRELTAK